MGYVACMGDAYRSSVGKPEGKRPLGRHRCTWEDNIIMDLREIRVGECGLGSSGSGLGSVVGPCKHCNGTSGSIKGGEFCDQLSDY